MFSYNFFHRISKIYKKIRERNRVSTEPNILPTADELALRLSGHGQMSSINQVAGLNVVNSVEEELAAELNVVNIAEDGPAAELNVVNSSEDGPAAGLNVVNSAEDGLATGLFVVNSAEIRLPAVLETVNRSESSMYSNSTTPNTVQVQVDNTPVPEIIISVSSIVQVNI